MARTDPSSTSAAATRSAIAGSPTPTTWRRTRAGLASGPRKLKVVGTPIWVRAGPAKRNPAWNFCAKQNPIPTRSMQRATPSPSRSITTPSDSSTSAEPHRDDAARFPCLATRTPAPATTSAVVVEMLNVCDRSPPVPQVSMSGPAVASSATGTGSVCSSIVRTSAASSVGVSPLARSATAKAAICASVALPWRIVAIAAEASSASRSSRRRSGMSTSGQWTVAAASVTGQSHQRSWSSTPRAMRPSCTWLVPSTIVSCFASR